jgi:tetrapyrrole methylase family protein / MazG family protein
VERLLKIMAQLRSPQGCPWDREQTHASLKMALLEEAYEVLEAIDSGKPASLREELGDLLLHVVFHAQIASEAGLFDFEQVVQEIGDKLVRRHPHVFAEGTASNTSEVLQQWEAIKKREKPERTSALDGVPRPLPALMRAQEVQKKAAKVGFDWPDAAGAHAKILEELAEVEQAKTAAEVEAELGDLFFALVNYTRHRQVNAELALTGATDKFTRRFVAVEAAVKASGREWSAWTLAELDAAWEEAKKGEV